MIFVTGGAGFIGSNFVHQWIAEEKTNLYNIDKLTYAGNLNNLAPLEHDPRHHFVQGDINDHALLNKLFQAHKPQAVIHFAAETHVDRSIHAPREFFQTNVMGTEALLHTTLSYWKQLSKEEQKTFRVLNISTDEVYGSLQPDDKPSKETDSYAPNSPYAASKASSDYLARSYFHTYGMPVITTHCSNNFGPYQFPEKLLPLLIVNALQHKPIPLYGDGLNIRNWIYVEDHCHAIRKILEKGTPGETYNIGTDTELTNKDLVLMTCAILDELKPSGLQGGYASLIKYVKDRPGHDKRYSLDSSKIKKQMHWKPAGQFSDQLRFTVEWYLRHLAWVENVVSGEYRDWITTNYYERETVS